MARHEALLLPIVLLALVLAPPPAIHALQNGFELPALGWSTWNFFATNISEAVLLRQGDALVASGLRDLGFKHINLDAGYIMEERDAKWVPCTSPQTPSDILRCSFSSTPPPHPSGNLQVNAALFPRGMRAVADDLAAKGLVLGLYTDLANGSCGHNGPGSLGHYEQDARTFINEWGARYLKVDYCGQGVPYDAETQWAHWHAFAQALNATGEHVYFDICPKTQASTSPSSVVKPFGNHLVYAPPLNWTAEQRDAAANSQLVEFTNTFDLYYCDGSAGCALRGIPSGLITNIDSMVAMTHLSTTKPGR